MILPWLGRMNLGSSLKSVQDFPKVMKAMGRLPQIYVPLLFIPKMAIASGMPPGFEEFDPVFIRPPDSFDFIEFMVNLNKNCILEVM